MSKYIDYEKNNSKPNGRKPFLESCIMYLPNVFLLWETYYNFLIFTVLKDPKPKNILHLF